MTVIAQAQGVHPLYAGTDTPIGVDEGGTHWAISYQGGGQKRAVLVATFTSGASLEFKIPATGITKSGSVAAFTIPDFGNAQWVTYAEHVKFEVRFPAGPPKVQTISTNIARLGCDLVSDDEGGLTVLASGVKVGALPRPWLDYTPDGSEDRTRVWLNWTVAEPQMSLTLPTLTASEWQTAVLDPTVVTSSTAGTATAYSNQRKIDRTSNGVLWSMFWDGTSTTGTSMDFYYSTDDGATWARGGEFGFAGTGTTYVPNGSLFIDLDPDTGDEYAHVAYKDRHNGYIYYRRGTPNAARTTWTWSAATLLASHVDSNYPDVVAHREGAGWVTHVSFSFISGAANYVLYSRVTIASDGGVTVGNGGLGNAVGPAGANGILAGSYDNGNHTWPSVDFNHTGDSKTVAGSTPHLYVAWSAGATGAGKGIRFKKATYSGGSWTWGTEREIDSASFANVGRISSVFDGTQVVIAYADSQSTSAIKIRERNAADTTTTTHTPTALSDGVVTGLTIAYDNDKNIHLGAVGATSADPKVLKYDRAAGTWGAWEALAATTTQADTLTAGRFADTSVDLLYTSGTGSPYSVTHAAVPLVTDQHESGGAAASISAVSSGAGVPEELASRGAAASVTVATSGAGSPSEAVSRGASATTTVTTTGAGQAVETVATGAAAIIGVSATGAGTGTEAATSSAATSVTVTTTGDGNAATENSSGSSARVTISATGAGVARENVTGGSGATVVIVTTGGTAEPQAESGGASATIQITAYTGSAATERASAGATALVTIHTTGRGTGGDPTARDLSITAKLDPARMRATLDRDRMYATLNPDRLAARMEAQ
jgi:hypothetical protein